MTMQKINMIKSEYLRDLIAKGAREGSRGPFDYRSIKITNNFIPNAEGSTSVELGNTKVVVGVKLGVDSPMPDKPEEGNLIVSAELLPLASAEYETGPPSPESIEFARVVDRGIRAAGVVDTSALFIEEDKVWSVFVDVYVLNYAGNLFDAAALGAVSALHSTRMPKYEDEKVIREGRLGMLKVNNTVTSCTYAKIGNKLLLDPSEAEESIMDGRLTIANDEKFIRAMQKGLSGPFSAKEVEELIEMSFDKSKELRRIIGQAKD